MPPRSIVVNPAAPSNTLSFSLPPGVSIDVESVLAAIDASAAGDTTALLTIADSSGAVIARKRQTEVVSAGTNPGSATWALRLADEQAPAPASGGDYVFIAEQTRNVSNVIQFSGIPATFRHLVLDLSLTRTVAGVATALIKWNGATTWSSAFVYMNAPNGALSRSTEMVDGDGVYLNFGHVNGAVGTSRPFELPTDGSGDAASFVVQIPWYARTDRYHKIMWQGAVSRFAAFTYATGSGTDETGATFAAIDTLTIMCQTGVLGVDSVATLYGIK